MEAKKISALLAKANIFFTVYDIITVEISGEIRDIRTMVLVVDFDTQEEAELFCMVNSGSYHSLTVIKRYE